MNGARLALSSAVRKLLRAAEGAADTFNALAYGGEWAPWLWLMLASFLSASSRDLSAVWFLFGAFVATARAERRALWLKARKGEP